MYCSKEYMNLYIKREILILWKILKFILFIKDALNIINI